MDTSREEEFVEHDFSDAESTQDEEEEEEEEEEDTEVERSAEESGAEDESTAESSDDDDHVSVYSWWRERERWREGGERYRIAGNIGRN